MLGWDWIFAVLLGLMFGYCLGWYFLFKTEKRIQQQVLFLFLCYIGIYSLIILPFQISIGEYLQVSLVLAGGAALTFFIVTSFCELQEVTAANTNAPEFLQNPHIYLPKFPHVGKHGYVLLLFGILGGVGLIFFFLFHFPGLVHSLCLLIFSGIVFFEASKIQITY